MNLNNNNMMMNSPRTTAGYMNEGNDSDNNYVRNTQQNKYYNKISISPTRNFGMNRTSYNYYNANNNQNKKMNYNNNVTNLDIKLEDLIMIEEYLHFFK